MPSIYLKETTGTYNAGSVSVNVTCEEYPHSNLFTRYKHTFSPSATGKIYIFNGIEGWVFSCKCLTLTRDNGYTTAKLTEAHVYFNKYDTDHKNPLLFVLKFNGEASPGDKYYTRSKFKSMFSTDGGQSVSISSLHTYDDNEKSILNDLIKENDQLPELLTYNIGRTGGDPPNGNGKYNGGKICVQESDGEPKLESTGFRRYKHTPALGGGNESKKACVIWNNNLLLQKGGTGELRGIQDRIYSYIYVYYSNKVVEPLLVEFNQGGSSSNTSNKYYYHTWKDNGDGKTLYWKEIAQSDNVLNVQLPGTDVHTTLTESGGIKLLEVLRAIETHLQKTIISINKF